MRIAIAQIDYLTGAFDANLEAMKAAARHARRDAVSQGQERLCLSALDPAENRSAHEKHHKSADCCL